MKKVLSFVFCLTIMLCTLSFVGCDKNEPTVYYTLNNQTQIAESINQTETYFYNNIYGSSQLETANTYNSTQLTSIFDGFNGFVAIGTVTDGELKTISFGNRTYELNQLVKIKIADNIYYSDKIIYVEENTIYVNSLALSIELRNNQTFALNNTTATIPVAENQDETPGYSFMYGFTSLNTIEKPENIENVFNINIRSLENINMYIDNLAVNSYVRLIKSYGDGTTEYEFNKSIYHENTFITKTTLNLVEDKTQNFSVTYQVIAGNKNPFTAKLNITYSV